MSRRSRSLRRDRAPATRDGIIPKTGIAAIALLAGTAVAAADRDRVAHGEIELRGGDSADVHLIAAAPGRYDVHCSHLMHAAMGMKGQILVE